MAGGHAREAGALGIRLRDRPDRLRASGGTPTAALVHARLHFPGTRGILLGPGKVAGGLEEAAAETTTMKRGAGVYESICPPFRDAKRRANGFVRRFSPRVLAGARSRRHRG